ncbi:MAG: hypothetical protein H6765_09970 [Candidatus Peribacteria bacterium]|nr:MAG: hypothetical protein H6765_09970 [Candidatus Peribacteria bacterium]
MKISKSYLIYETNKPSDSSLPELGFSLTGRDATPITIEYTEKICLGHGLC